MPVYLSSFYLPVSEEESILKAQMLKNAGKFKLTGDKLVYESAASPTFGYIDNPYPCGIFGGMELFDLSFSGMTILYGGNGSGKSTLLNLIAKRLNLKRTAPHNSGELFDLYASKCDYSLGCDDEGEEYEIPEGSRILTSDDVFDYMLAARTNNEEIGEAIDIGKAQYAALKFGDTVPFTGLEDYETHRLQVLTRSKSLTRRKFLRQMVGSETRLYSNGETALSFFEDKLKNDTLYCLDEPENSMAPAMQLELAERLSELVRFCGCQLIIATHSPFLLAMKGARIYDLDSRPAAVKNWWELENTRIWFDFFEKHRGLFTNDPTR